AAVGKRAWAEDPDSQQANESRGAHRGIVSMKESSTYQAILEEGRGEGAIAEARKLLRVFGENKFGPPDSRTAAALKRIDDLARLEELCGRLESAKGWPQLLGQTARARNGGRRR